MRLGGAAVFSGCVFPYHDILAGFLPLNDNDTDSGLGEEKRGEGQVLDHVFSFHDFEAVIYASEIHAAVVAPAFPADAAGAELVGNWGM